MGTKKMSLANIKGMLSRSEMKNIMAGSGDDAAGTCGSNCDQSCTITCNSLFPRPGNCHRNATSGRCYCWLVC